jgi:hypothetical protein
MKRSSRHPKSDSTRRPEAERAYLAGLLELLTDSPARCREAVALVPPEAITIEAGAELLVAIAEAADLEAPSLADVLRIVRERATDPAADGMEPEKLLAVSLVDASVGNRGGYARGVERHAREIMKAAGRRRTIEAAQRAEAVAADPAAEPAEIEAAAAAVAEASASVPTERMTWEPFPVSLLPEPVGTFVIEAAERLSTDPVFVALPILASVAATIGNSRRIELWDGWREPPILWLAVVADSGTMKTPSMDAALQFIRQRQDDAFREYRAAMADYEREKREHDRASRRRDAEAAEPPERPVAERFVVDDVTIEGLGPILEQNPRGVFLARDELSGWLEGFDRYSGGRGGGEAGRWLSLYNASPLTVDRKLTGTLYVPSAAVSIYGGIQPKTLARALGQRHVDNGLAQRFILASPPRRMKAIPRGDVNFATIEAVRSMFGTLGMIRPAEDGSPKVIDLEPEAADAWRAFYEDHARETYIAGGHVASMLGKAEGWAARLVLVFHLIAQAGADPARGDRIRADSIEAGVGVARWAAREWERVFAEMTYGAALADDAGLREWIAGRGGVASSRDVRRGLAKYRDPGAAEAGLRRLVRAGKAEWHASPTGGRPADAVRLK